MEMQHGMQHGRAAWTCSMYTWTCSMHSISQRNIFRGSNSQFRVQLIHFSEICCFTKLESRLISQNFSPFREIGHLLATLIHSTLPFFVHSSFYWLFSEALAEKLAEVSR
jgi:hypothetical protein